MRAFFGENYGRLVAGKEGRKQREHIRTIRWVADNLVEFDRLVALAHERTERDEKQFFNIPADGKTPVPGYHVVLMGPSGEQKSLLINRHTFSYLHNTKQKTEAQTLKVPPALTQEELDVAALDAGQVFEKQLAEFAEKVRENFKKGWGVSMTYKWEPGKRGPGVTPFHLPVSTKE